MRMVRSVKSALASLSTGGKPDDVTFRTILIEAESIVNSRPLTYFIYLFIYYSTFSNVFLTVTIAI